ncbi:MAG: CAP domain-containing protein [Psychromonas sp.]
MRLLFLPTSIVTTGLLLTACSNSIDYPAENSFIAPQAISASQPTVRQISAPVSASKPVRALESEPSQAFVQQMLSAVNSARARGANCGGKRMPPVAPLTWNKKLQQAAFVHSNNMAKNDFFNHRGLDGKSSSQRVSDAGYHWRAAGENIAAGVPDVATAMAGWLSSPGHCVNMMSADFTEMAAARVNNSATYYGSYWTQVFAAPF